MRKRKPKVVTEFKCDQCGDTTPNFISTADYKHYCLEHKIGQEPTKDCLGDYIQSTKDSTI